MENVQVEQEVTSMRVGFWLDWNSNVHEEMQLHTQWLHLILDRDITTFLIESPANVAHADVDLMTFDYGGICGGYGPNEIVPALLRSIVEWCEANADRLAVMWCTFPPDWYLADFKRFGGVPSNLRCAYQVLRHSTLEQELKARYALESSHG
jgi:hypothetical protein